MNESLPPQYDVAIIGAGFSGSMVAIHLLASARGPLRVALLNKSENFGRGIAYGTRCPSHLLNVPAARMSAFVDDPDDFHRWLQHHRSLCQVFGVEGARGNQFIPRVLFGNYVSELLERKIATAPLGLVLKKIVADVQDIQECPGGMRVWLDEQTNLTARKVVLAPGNFPPGDLPLKDRKFYRSQCYLGTPWSEQNLDRIRRAKDVLILGTGLTAIDLILTLREEGVAERIHLLARHGRLPQEHRPAAPYPPFLSEDYQPKSLRELSRRVRAEIRQAAARGIDWRPVLDSLRARTPALWHALPTPEKKRFLRHLRVLWEVHRHRVPSDLLREVTRLEEAGILIRHRGRVQRMRVTAEGRASVEYSSLDGSAEEVETEMVVNCTGPESNYRKLNDPLILNLLARGLIHPDPLLLGLEVAPNGALVSVRGDYSRAFYTLGSPRRGQLYESTAVPELRQQAQALARHLVDELHPRMVAQGVPSFEI